MKEFKEFLQSVAEEHKTSKIENINKVVTEIVYNFINCVEIEKTKKYLQ